MDQTGHQPIQALDEFLVTAMGAKDLATRLDNALKLQRYLQDGIADFSIEESHDEAFAAIAADYDRDPDLFSAYFATLSRAQAMTDKFLSLSDGELKYIDYMLKHAYANRIETMGELFDHRTWLQIQKDRNRYVLPIQDGAYARSKFKGAFRPSESRLALYFLNVEVPRPAALGVGGILRTQSWPMAKFDTHVQERRAAMKQESRLQARGLFLSWFEAVPLDYTRILFGHLFPQSEEFKLKPKHNLVAIAQASRRFIENSAIRDAIVNTDYKVAEPEITTQVDEYAPIAETKISSDIYDVPEAAPVVAENNVVPLFQAPVSKTSREPINMSLAGAKVSVEDLFPSYDRDPIVVRPRKPVSVAPKMVATELPTHPRRKPGTIFKRVAAAAASVFVLVGVGTTFYEPARTASTQTLQSLWKDVTGETRREQERTARAIAEAKKPVLPPKIVARYGEPVKPVFNAAMVSSDPYRPKPVRTTVEPGVGIQGLMHR